MNIRAVIFDIYGTLLDVGSPPADAEQLWKKLCLRMLPDTAGAISLAEFGWRCQVAIDREHDAARTHGIPFPEVFWPDIVCEILPGLRDLSPVQRGEFQFEQTRLWHSTSLAAGAAGVLKRLTRARLPLGLASNCQPYTLREFDEALATAGLSRRIFDRSLCFLSFEHGFSKPDPHAFHFLAARLAAAGIAPEESLVVGDREDNEIAPAKAQGFQTWLLTGAAGDGANAGNWLQFAGQLRSFQ
jgi:FMN phosphatase YigB (HAD superfamily)